MENRYFIYLAYNGTNFHGWQIQPNGISVQETLEQAFSLLLGETIAVTGAGRTDTGVHAKLMVAHIDVSQPIIDIQSLIGKLNSITVIIDDLILNCCQFINFFFCHNL